MHFALAFLALAVIAGVLGYGELAGGYAGIAKILFYFLLAAFVLALFRARWPRA